MKLTEKWIYSSKEDGSTKSTLPSMKWAKSRAWHWQQRFRLSRYRVFLRKGQPNNPEAAMEIHVYRNQNIAQILVPEKTWKLAKEDFEKHLVHELLHLVVDPMWEEADLQRQYAVAETRQDEMKERHHRAMEQVVALLTDIVYTP